MTKANQAANYPPLVAIYKYCNLAQEDLFAQVPSDVRRMYLLKGECRYKGTYRHKHLVVTDS